MFFSFFFFSFGCTYDWKQENNLRTKNMSNKINKSNWTLFGFADGRKQFIRGAATATWINSHFKKETAEEKKTNKQHRNRISINTSIILPAVSFRSNKKNSASNRLQFKFISNWPINVIETYFDAIHLHLLLALSTAFDRHRDGQTLSLSLSERFIDLGFVLIILKMLWEVHFSFVMDLKLKWKELTRSFFSVTDWMNAKKEPKKEIFQTQIIIYRRNLNYITKFVCDSVWQANATLR